MQERYVGRLKPDMDVCDVNGDKVGAISHVYRYADAAVVVGGTSQSSELADRPPYDEVIEVKTGFLGLGSHLYIPLSAVQDTLDDCVFVSSAKDDFERLGWHDTPLYLDQLQ